MSNKQSSVEWFAKESWNLQIRLENKEIRIGEYCVTYVDLLEQAKEMHKEEVTQAHTTGYIIGGGNGELYEPKQYYNETYGGNND